MPMFGGKRQQPSPQRLVAKNDRTRYFDELNTGSHASGPAVVHFFSMHRGTYAKELNLLPICRMGGGVGGDTS
jgi:hypothetical protein